MSDGFQVKLDPKFASKLKKRVEGYQFEVGILDKNQVHRDPKRGVRGLRGQDVLSTYAGGPVRRAERSSKTGITTAQVAKNVMQTTGINWLRAPFKDRSNRDIREFAKFYLKSIFRKPESNRNRLQNLMQAIVRNPILRGDYGHNKELTRKIKTFDRLLIDTGQMFKAIRARVVKRG